MLETSREKMYIIGMLKLVSFGKQLKGWMFLKGLMLTVFEFAREVFPFQGFPFFKSKIERWFDLAESKKEKMFLRFVLVKRLAAWLPAPLKLDVKGRPNSFQGPKWQFVMLHCCSPFRKTQQTIQLRGIIKYVY